MNIGIFTEFFNFLPHLHNFTAFTNWYGICQFNHGKITILQFYLDKVGGIFYCRKVMVFKALKFGKSVKNHDGTAHLYEIQNKLI